MVALRDDEGGAEHARCGGRPVAQLLAQFLLISWGESFGWNPLADDVGVARVVAGADAFFYFVLASLAVVSRTLVSVDGKAMDGREEVG